MKRLRIHIKHEAKAPLVVVPFVLALALSLLPQMIYWLAHKSISLNAEPLFTASLIGTLFVVADGALIYLLSRFSPVSWLRVRKKLILFTEMLTKQTADGNFWHSVEWRYKVADEKIIIELFSSGLVSDKATLGIQLSEFLRENLLKFEELNDRVRFTFGAFPAQLDGIDTMTANDKLKNIPIYDTLSWDLTSEACHQLIIAPSGAGKTMFLSYEAGMVLKNGHNLHIIDAKNTSFGASYKSVGVPVASNADEILTMLTNLVDKMEDDYQTYFSSENVGIDANFSNLKLPAHVLIFDEVLSALNTGDKKQNAEMERLLKLLALKGRMAGYILVLASQKLLATDLPKAVTEQCQTRFILGANVSDELFHLATGSYKKDLATSYKGGKGTGYALTPETGLTYFETPFMDFKKADFRSLMFDLKQKGQVYGEGS